MKIANVRTLDSLHVRRLSGDDRVQFSMLLQAYRTEMNRSPCAEEPDCETAAALFFSRTAEVMGGFLGAKLLAFAIFFDLPEAISGRRAGQLDDLYVVPEARGERVAQRMIEAIAELGRARDWVHLRWLVPEDNEPARKTYDRFAASADWKSYALWLRDGTNW